MIWVYRLLFVSFLPLIPFWIKHFYYCSEWRYYLWHRLGFVPKQPLKAKDCKRIWIQAVSVGELKAINPLLQEIEQDGGYEIILTTTTHKIGSHPNKKEIFLN